MNNMNDSPYTNKSNNIDPNDQKDSISEFDQDCNTNMQTVSLLDYERLKEEYILTAHQKKTLEIESIDLNEIKDKYTVLKEDYERLKDLSSQQREHICKLEQESKCYLQQIEKQTKDKDELIDAITALRQNLNLSEIEKSEIKIKNAHHLSKFKNMECEIAKLTKKNNILTNNVKDLLNKLHNETEFKKALQQKNEEKVEELENKIVALENEKKKITKDSMTAFVESTAKKMNNLSLYYNPNYNKIEIKYDNEIIGEVNNNDNKGIGDNNNSNPYTNSKAMMNAQIKSPFNLKKEATICRFRQLTCYDKFLQQTNSNQKQMSPNNKNVSLRKLFSNQKFSISSQNSCESNTFFEDKENQNTLNLNMITLNSIGKKYSTNYNTNVIIKEKDVTCFNDEINISKCILNADLTNESLTFRNKNPPIKKKEEKNLSITSQECMSVITSNYSKVSNFNILNVEYFGIELITKTNKAIEDNIKAESYVSVPVNENDKDHFIDYYQLETPKTIKRNKNSKDNVKVITSRNDEMEKNDSTSQAIREKKKGICFSCCIF